MSFLNVILVLSLTCCASSLSSADHDAFEEAVQLRKVRIFPLSTAHMKAISQTEKISGLDIYCHEKELKQRISRIWRSVTLRLRTDDSRYVLYRGPNASAVWRQWVDASQSWLNLMPWKTDTVSLALFNDTCIGVDTLANYSIQVYIKPIDPQILAFFLMGIVLFFTADRLSKWTPPARGHSVHSQLAYTSLQRNSGQQKKTEDEKNKIKNGEMGSGRVIPIKQGYLYKKSSKPLNKDWKKKYVTLLDDGRFSYFPSLHDYMDDVHGKEINLVRTTVKIPGQKPRGSRGSTENPANTQQTSNNNVSLRGRPTGTKESVVLTGFDVIRETGLRPGMCEESVVIPNSSLPPDVFNNGGMDMLIHTSPQGGTPNSKVETPNVKKRHRRAKSGTNKNLDPGQDGDSDGYEFVIVSLDNKQWQFEAATSEEREEWVTAIEQQILASLQGNESNKSKSNSMTDPAAGQAIRGVKGNGLCADCDAPNPDWASLNLGSLICIECSGIHRNLGTHLSRVRSLDLDEWPPELVSVMVVIGNHLVNMIWEANMKGRPKPTPTSSREEKERWIRAKYEQKEFLPPPPYNNVPLTQQLIDAIARQDVYSTILVLSYCSPDHVNTPYNKSDTRTALHIAAALGNVILVQLLLWYGANVSAVDHEGHNALWFARSAGSIECVELLHNQGCPDNPSLPRQRGSLTSSTGGNDVFDRLPASII